MARIETDPNYTTPTFSRATAATDPFKKEDVQLVAAALSTHDHTSGKGLPAGALVPNITVPGGAVSVSGNLTFTGTGNRILGDFSNATLTNQVAIQTSTPGGSTNLSLLPNGAGILSALTAWGGSDPSNASGLQLNAGPSAVAIHSFQTGSGVAKPLSFLINAVERLRIDVAGQLSTYSSLTLNTARGPNAAGIIMQAGVGGSGNDVQLFSENGFSYLWFSNVAGVLNVQTSSGGAWRPVNASAFNISSSKIYKENLVTLDQATMLAQVLDPTVQPISYSLIESGDVSIGFIAEDMLGVVPESVTLNADGDPQGINYNALVPILWGAVRELTARVTTLEGAA